MIKAKLLVRGSKKVMPVMMKGILAHCLKLIIAQNQFSSGHMAQKLI
jgi:hypothetical protein